ncbi:PRC-barrel domain-containing protein [Arenibaculum pallidiluteum]|uniref:PRC-barrel domain-containing protein n=1 Tax=Arenibaculum pallidiluteum TaxID=2812559 RepID=UPI001A96D9ED|nr:PRC-barrel domain-containing protein [Arenibaculum pallidiluteum]
MRRMLFASAALLSLGACGTIENITGTGETPRPVATSETQSIDNLAASELMEMNVIGRDGSSLGEVNDVLVDSRGRPQRVILHRGGVLGFGGKNVALDVDDLRRAAARDALVATDVTAETADRLPEATTDGSLVSLNKGRQSP